jgi:hypothetical protein
MINLFINNHCLFCTMRKLLTLIIFNLLLICFVTKAQITPPALAAIKTTDLKRDIFELAGDSFRGRRAGSLDEMRSAVWVAQKAQEAGLKPAGEDGTYFQFFNIHRTRVANDGCFTLNNPTYQFSARCRCKMVKFYGRYYPRFKG